MAAILEEQNNRMIPLRNQFYFCKYVLLFCTSNMAAMKALYRQAL